MREGGREWERLRDRERESGERERDKKKKKKIAMRLIAGISKRLR